MIGLLGPQLWPYVYDYLSLSASNGLRKGQGLRLRAQRALLTAVGARRAGVAGMKLASYRRPELSRLLQNIRANIQASRHYVPHVYPGHMTFFQSDTGPVQGGPDLISRWRRLAVGGSSVYPIPGRHLDLLRQPHVRELAKRLEACLDQAQLEHSLAHVG